jgi:cAMP-dependent protein kinase regulator
VGDKFYMMSEGSAVATKLQPDGSQKQVLEYSPGMYFGEKALLENEARAANVIAQSDVVCLSLDRETFIRLLGPLDAILKRNMEGYKNFQ